MRYVIVLSLFFALKSTAVATTATLPAATKLLEIRSLPAVGKPANSLLQKVISLGEGKVFGMCAIAQLTGTVCAFAMGADALSAAMLGAGAAMTTLLAGVIPKTVRGLKAMSVYMDNEERRVYYTERHDGKSTLHFGQLTNFRVETGMLVVKASDGSKAKYRKVYYKDLGGISIPEHQDLGKQVRFLTEVSSNNDDYLYDLGEVVEVYDSGHYEIEVDRKVSYYDNVTIPIDNPHTVFVHASLTLTEGGFEFADSKVSEHVASENVHIISAAREVDQTQDEVELEQGQAVE